MTTPEQARQILEKLRERQADYWDAIKRLDMGEFDNGMMTSIRFEQHDLYRSSADCIESQLEQLEKADVSAYREAMNADSDFKSPGNSR
jgi:hypothetical protein